MAEHRRLIVGLTWKKFENSDDDSPSKTDENANKEVLTTTARITRSISRGSIRKPLAETTSTLKRQLSFRVQSMTDGMRDAIGNLKQKMRTSTRRKKRLVNSSPYRVSRASSRASTPASAQRRSARLAQQEEVEEPLYSPFTIDTPSKTPNRIRMGIHSPKRFNFSSPGQLRRDMDRVAQGLHALTDMSDNLNKAAERQSCGIRTTPKAGPSKTPTQRRKQVFV